MEIPHQDKMVFNSTGKTGDVEHLTPPPEQPIDAMTASSSAPTVETPSLAAEPNTPASVPASSGPITSVAVNSPATMPASAPAIDQPSAADTAALGRTVQPDGKAQAATPIAAAPVEAAPAFNAGGNVKTPKPVAPSVAKTPEVEPVIPAKPPGTGGPDPMPPELLKPEANMAMEPAVKPSAKVTQKAVSAGGSRVQLASFNDRAAASRAVSTFSKKYGSLQNVNIVEATVKGKRVYRVQASGNASTCSSVKSQGGTCVVVRP